MLAQQERELALNICCIGAGYVGGPTSAVMAYKCPNVVVTILDVDEGRIGAWQHGPLPVYEPGLDDIVTACRNKNLFFTTDASVISRADIILIAVNTPTKTRGVGAGAAADLCYVECAVKTVLKQGVKQGAILVEKSTVPWERRMPFDRLYLVSRAMTLSRLSATPSFWQRERPSRTCCTPIES